MSGEGLARAVLRHAERRPDLRVASYLRSDGEVGESLGYAELAGRASTLARRLADTIEPGARVLLSAHNTPEFAIAFFACQFGGYTAVPAPLDHGAMSPGKADRLRHVLRVSDPSAMLCAASAADEARAWLDRYGAADTPVIAVSLHDEVDAAPTPARGVSGAPALIQFTSGSEAAPRGVVIGGAAIEDNVARIMAAWAMDEHDLAFNWMPLYHDMGLVGGLITPVCGGFRCLQWSAAQFVRRPERWMDLSERHGVTTTGGPPFALERAIMAARSARGEAGSPDGLSGLKRVYCGAQPVPADLLDRFAATFAPRGLRRDAVFCTYGLAEATLYVAGRPGAPHREPAPEFVAGMTLDAAARRIVRLVDPDTGAEVAEGEIGEVELSGPSLADGYRGEGEARADAFLTGPHRLRTGDLATIRGGALFIVGRSKDVFFANGRKIAAATLEFAAARLHPALDPHGAVTVEAPGPVTASGPELILRIERKSRRDIIDDEAALERRIAAQLTREFGVRIAQVEFLPPRALPRTPSGKVRRRAHMLGGAEVEHAGGDVMAEA
ncbi:MAG: AMP-binding protein [Oceanicaulis sp.]